MAVFLKPGMKGRARRAYSPMSEINVTPMVDVMLVLLVIFMVAAPLLTTGVPVDLPKTESAALKGQDEPLSITVTKDGQLFLQDTEVEIGQLVPRLEAIIDAKSETRIFVRGDESIAYGRVMDVMGRLAAAGFTRVGLVTEQPERR